MKYVLANTKLLDGTLVDPASGAASAATSTASPATAEMAVQENAAVFVEDGRFMRIVTGSETESALTQARVEGWEVEDVQGAYLMPGLINMHVHLPVEGTAPRSEHQTDFRRLVQLLQRFRTVKSYILLSEITSMKNQLLSGVTTLRAVGGIKDWDGITRNYIESGKAPGPRILAANMAISVPGGHFAGSLATEATSAEEAAEHARQIIATNPDLLKLMITGGVMDATEEGEPGALRMAPELVRAAADVAHAAGLKVAAHVESTEGVLVALQNGVDTIEHGAVPTDEIMRLFKERGAADICTISPAIPYALMPLDVAKCGEVGRKNGRIVMDGIIECARRCLAEGVPVGLGTDTGCPFITHYNMWRELVYFAHYCEVSNAFALHTATLVNAQILGLENEIGSIEVGKCADFIVCRENPLENLEALRHLEMVACDGAIIRNPQPKPVKGVDAALDAVVLD